MPNKKNDSDDSSVIVSYGTSQDLDVDVKVPSADGSFGTLRALHNPKARRQTAVKAAMGREASSLEPAAS